MKIAVLGAGGQLGSEWYAFLEKQSPAVEFAAAGSSDVDVTDPAAVEAFLKAEQPAQLINCAAYTQVDKAEEEVDKARLINAEAVKQIALLCKKHNVQLIHYSTDYVFAGKAEDKERYPDGYSETHPAEPVNSYGQTKWDGEQSIRSTGCRHLIIRLSWLCGRHGHNFVKTMLNLGRKQGIVKVVNDQWGCPTFAEEVVKNTFTLIKEGAKGTYHISSRGLTNWAEFASAVFDYAGMQARVQPVTSEEFPTKAKRPKFSKLSTKKIEKIPGITICSWQDGLKRLLKQIEI